MAVSYIVVNLYCLRLGVTVYYNFTYQQTDKSNVLFVEWHLINHLNQSLYFLGAGNKLNCQVELLTVNKFRTKRVNLNIIVYNSHHILFSEEIKSRLP